MSVPPNDLLHITRADLPWLSCSVTSSQQERPENKSHGYKAFLWTHVNQRPLIIQS